MKRLLVGHGQSGDVTPEDVFLNLYTNTDNVSNYTRATLNDAQHNRSIINTGITLRIRRDVDGDFTITKVEEF